MNQFILLLLLFSSIAQADELDCGNATTTIEINECVAEKLTLAHKEMQQYLQASIATYYHDAIVAESIKQAQRAWLNYMELHCDSVYSVWREGSIRNVMSLGCQITLTQQRTHELWSQYLRSQDSTSSALPEPYLPSH